MRRALESDASGLAGLRSEFWSDQIAKGSLDNPDLAPAQLLADTQRWVKRARTSVFLAADRNQVVGYIIGQTRILPGVAGALISSVEEVFVVPGLRRSTVAKDLVASAMAEFRVAGAQRVQLRVLERNGEGKRFWERLGFSASVVLYEYTADSPKS